MQKYVVVRVRNFIVDPSSGLVECICISLFWSGAIHTEARHRHCWFRAKVSVLYPVCINTMFACRLGELGYRVGLRLFELLCWRDRAVKRETKHLQMLIFIHSVVWKTLFGKQADSLEKSNDHADECNYWSLISWSKNCHW
jgi:hypothetical protein